MNSTLKKGALSLLLLCTGAGTGQALSPEVDDDKRAVSAVVQGSVDEILAFLTNDELTKKQQRDGVTGVIDRMADLELLAKLSLGKTHWLSADDAQRQTFTELFVETIRHSTYEKLELFTDERVEVGAPEPITTSGAPKYKVVCWVISKGDRIEVAFMLAEREEGWKVYDLEIEGVSIRKSYGSQYADFLREQSFYALLDEMQAKVAAAREKLAEQDARAGEPAEEQPR